MRMAGADLVKIALGKRVFLGGESHQGCPLDSATTPPATPKTYAILDFRIRRVDQCYFLEWEPQSHSTDRPDDLRLWGDIYLETLDDAILQAKLIFGLEPSDWKNP